jgi:mannose-6-phosphate isomerase-like protein (cupin superfamily)
MIVPFDQISEVVIPNFRGGEKELSARMFKDERNLILFGKLIAGASVGLHTHETSSEIIYITEGTGKVLYDGIYEPVSKGICHYCPKGHSHSLINDSETDLVFFALVPEQ